MSLMHQVLERVDSLVKRLEALENKVIVNDNAIVEGDVEVVEEKYVPVDTKELQLADLEAFMVSLAYYWDTKGFVSYGYHKQFDRISFTSAVALYNTKEWELTPEGCFKPTEERLAAFAYPSYLVRAAFGGKRFQKLKMHWSKKREEWIYQSNKLTMMHPEYYKWFIAPLKEQKNGSD